MSARPLPGSNRDEIDPLPPQPRIDLDGGVTQSCAVASPEDDSGIALILFNREGQIRYVPILDGTDHFMGQMRQHRDGQPSVQLTLQSRGSVIGRISLDRPADARKDSPIVVEIVRDPGDASWLVVRMWDPQGEGRIERRLKT